MASSPCTPQAQGRAPTQQQEAVLQSTDAANHPIDTLSEQLLSCTISKPRHKREQTSATPASQARPRTQRRTTPDGQENTCTSPEDDATDSVTPSRLSCLSELQDELSCAVCLEICVRPCATPCGHAFCRSCLRQALQAKRQCPKCRATLPPPSSWQPKVNTALWNTIQLLFPRHAAQAPPPTPEVQVAAANSRARTAAGTSQARHRHVADMLATGAAAGVFASDAAVRRGFRPPRPVDAAEAGWVSRATRGTRQQQQRQQQIDQFVMPADLGAMLHDMYRTGSGSGASRISQNTRSQTGTQPTQAPVSHQQQLGPQRSSSFERGQRQTVVLEDDSDNEEGIDWEQFDFSILDNLPLQQPQAASQNSSQQQGVQRSSRQQTRRAAAAARVHAAIADDLQGSSAATGGYSDDDEALRAAILASLRDAGAPAAASAAAAGSSSAAAAAGSRPLGQQHARRQRVQPSREQSAALFGLVHSGRSPQQQWAVHDDVRHFYRDDDDALSDENWLLDGSGFNHAAGGAATSQGSGSGSQASRTGVATTAGFNSRAVIQHYSMQMSPLGAHTNRDALHRRATVPGSTNAAVQTADGAGSAASLAVASEQRRRLGHQIASARPRRRCPGRRVIMSGNESPESDDEVDEPAGALHNPSAGPIQAASEMADRELGVATVQAADHERGIAAAASTAVDEPLDVSVLSLAPSPEPQPLAARLARFGSHPQQQHQQQQATVRPRSHQEAIFSELSTQNFDQAVSSAAGNSSSSNRNNNLTAASSSSQVASLRSRLANSSRSSRNDNSNSRPGSVSADRVDRLLQSIAPHAAPQMDISGVGDSSDDFEPASQLPGRRLTALRAVAAGTASSAGIARGAASGGRVVSGLRRADRGRHRRGDR